MGIIYLGGFLAGIALLILSSLSFFTDHQGFGTKLVLVAYIFLIAGYFLYLIKMK